MKVKYNDESKCIQIDTEGKDITTSELFKALKDVEVEGDDIVITGKRGVFIDNETDVMEYIWPDGSVNSYPMSIKIEIDDVIDFDFMQALKEL